MRIVQLGRHRFVKELDFAEMEYYGNLSLFLAHVNNDPPFDVNPHNITAAQVSRVTGDSPWDHTSELQAHTDNSAVHLTYGEVIEVYNAGDVSPGGFLQLSNTGTIQKIRIHVNGRKMIQGVDFFMTGGTLPDAIVQFLDPDFPIGNVGVNIEVEYRQNL